MPLTMVLQSSTLSNKAAISIPASYRRYPVSEHDSVYVSKPFIDRIVLVGAVNVGDVEASAAQQDKEAFQYFHDLLTVPTGWLHQQAHGFNHPKKPISGYVTGQKKIGGSQTLWGISRSKKNINRNIRLEFNPSKLGHPDALTEIEKEWEILFFGEISFSIWLQRARITALDIAVDFVNLPFNDIVVRHEVADKWSHWLSSGKQLQTLTSWIIAGKKRPALVVYDKRRELIETQHQPVFGPVPHLRVERRLQNKRIALSKLSNLPNPFSGVSVAHLPTAASKLPKMWPLFVYAAGLVGELQAASALPEKFKTDWSAALHAMPSAKFWLPDKIWRRWPNSLQTSGVQKWITTAQQ